MSEQTTAAPAKAAKHRPIDEINADLAAAEKRFRELEPQNRDEVIRRRQAVTRRGNLEAAWKRDPMNANLPFDPAIYSPPAHIPPEDTPISREFHKLHYTIARLQTEAYEAKRSGIND